METVLSLKKQYFKNEPCICLSFFLSQICSRVTCTDCLDYAKVMDGIVSCIVLILNSRWQAKHSNCKTAQYQVQEKEVYKLVHACIYILSARYYLLYRSLYKGLQPSSECLQLFVSSILWYRRMQISKNRKSHILGVEALASFAGT